MTHKRVNDEIMLEDVRMIWRNFAGEEKQYNAKGKRNFAIPLEDELAHQLLELGWNVKSKTRVNDEGAEETLHHLPVTVKMDGRVPPRLFMVTKSRNSRVLLDEETVQLLDYAEFDKVDVKLRPFNWDVQGKQGVSAYIKNGFFTLREDELELKYADVAIEDGSAGRLAIEAGAEYDFDGDVVGDTGWENETGPKEIGR